MNEVRRKALPRRKLKDTRPIDPNVLYYAWERAGKKKSTDNKTPNKKSTAPRALPTPKK